LTGALNWVQQLKWDGLNDYNSADRQWFVDDSTKQVEMYVKANDRFKFYWVLAAGHAVSSTPTLEWTNFAMNFLRAYFRIIQKGVALKYVTASLTVSTMRNYLLTLGHFGIFACQLGVVATSPTITPMSIGIF
jgi:hypothetical protein